MGLFSKKDDQTVTNEEAMNAEIPVETEAPVEAATQETLVAVAEAPAQPVQEEAVTPQEAAPVEQSAPLQAVTLDQLINLSIEKEASDLHFGEDARIALRVGGKIMFIDNVEKLSAEHAKEMIYEMLTEDEERAKFEEKHELDFSYTHKNGVNFRVNAYMQQGKLAVVMRMISKNLLPIDEIGAPDEVKALLSQREGLILVCGPAGSGKSTTIQSMLEYINQNFVKHVVTIENPIEYIFEPKQSIFTQREIGKDTDSIHTALQSASHQDPNVIVINEINDLKTLEEVLTLVETGHLVIASFTTKDSKQTLERMITMYPQAQRELARQRISETLLAILSQDLVDRADQTGRIAVYELLLSDQQVADALLRDRLDQLRTVMQSSAGEGMITLDTFAKQLAEQGVISAETAQEFIREEEQQLQ